MEATESWLSMNLFVHQMPPRGNPKFMRMQLLFDYATTIIMTKTQLHYDYSMTAEVTKVVNTKILQTSLRCEGTIQYYIYALYTPISKVCQSTKE